MSATTDLNSGPRPRRGFALPLAILALALITAAVAASSAATRAEIVANQAVRAQDRAYQMAEAGLQLFMARRTDVGLLFDPARTAEERFCRALRAALQRELPELKIDMNEPYSGVSDGLTTTLRAEFPKTRYLGIEFEVNQRLARGDRARWRTLQRKIGNALERALAV